MEKKEFDKKIKELLSDFEDTTYDSGSWDAFEEKLDFEEQMDDAIKSSVNGYKEPFNEAHWELLTQEIHRRKVRSIIKRSAEVLIVLLFILTAQNFLQFNHEQSSKSRQKVQIAQLQNTTPQISKFQEINLFATPSIREQYIKYSGQENQVSGETSAVRIDDISSKQTTSKTGSEIKTVDTRIVNEELIVTKLPKAQLLSKLNKRSINTLDVGFSVNKETTYDLIPLIEVPQAKNGLWVSIVAGADVNFINSPFDLSLLKSPLQSQSGALTYGVNLSKDFGNIEIASGIMFSEKDYYPYRIRQFVPSIDQKYLETSLRSVEYNQVQIPVLINYHTSRYSGLSMYGTAGIGMNIITNTYFDVETQVRSFNSAPTSTKGVESLNLRELPRGALQSGSFSNNFYTSAIVGFGIEKRVNNQIGFSLSTTYQRSLSKEINPIINRTQQIGVTLGLKANLR